MSSVLVYVMPKTKLHYWASKLRGRASKSTVSLNATKMEPTLSQETSCLGVVKGKNERAASACNVDRVRAVDELLEMPARRQILSWRDTMRAIRAVVRSLRRRGHTVMDRRVSGA